MANFCWHGFVRCISNRVDEPDRARYRTSSQVETIKFENLLTLEEKEKAARVPIVSETEAQYINEGRWDKITEEQMRRDMEVDEKLRQEEERLKREEDAYYAAKREATRKSKLLVSGGQTTGGGKGRSNPITTQPKPSTGSNKLYVTLDDDDDDEDFDKFLKSVQTKTTTAPPSSGDSPLTPPRSLHSITSDNDTSSEEEIDFGYWEKASVPKTSEGTTEGLRTAGTTTGNLKEIDLDLL